MEISIWVISALGLAATLPEALRVYRKYGLLLAGVIWLLMGVAFWLYAWTIVNGFSKTLPVNLVVLYLLLVITAPATLAIFIGRRYNVSVGVFLGGILVPLTYFIYAMTAYGLN
ncbi:hypothetical protein [Shinella sumterensis]|jgi:hypothetical protein|uniref:Uncharacterized protein n=1 Tax=Shinella sumterensis TaxID=1967501 RepID=A0AA50CKG0_9HYPH|nr:hypothetical protein [Shinella sumterensis]MCD1263850.1 hypothetical protein [Shinella sumterensis]TFE95246.1 hypothetical protein B5M44_21685 [Shinella sumterensis]WLR96129.1 hypothetical protein Q9313_10295 [Shinella sumterensis]